MVQKEGLAIRFLYGTPLGRLCLKALVRPEFSAKMGGILDSAPSRLLVRPYIRHNRIPMEGYAQVRYRSFNDFFTRSRRPECLRIDMNPYHLISPCDALLSAYRITQDSSFSIKHCTYSLESLLRDRMLAEHYNGGLCLIFRLTPQHYHRYCYIDDGRKGDNFSLPGVLHSVRPTCISTLPVFTENAREYTIMDTAHFGRVIQVEVGALMVGKICNDHGQGRIRRGEEKGHFAFGGSTIILLLEPGRVTLDSSIFRCTTREQEVSVRQGQRIGCAAGAEGTL